MENTDRAPAVGGVRYAPSPTGPLHLGNLRTAWISERIARELRLPWVVRFEDIDKPRVRPGAIQQQAADLAALGLSADHSLVQSSFHSRHWQLFLAAVAAGRVYPCTCSRQDVVKDLSTMASASHGGSAPTYSGRCRREVPRNFSPQTPIAWRLRQDNPRGTDDFILARAPLESVREKSSLEFTPSYHWACAIDDFDGGHQILVRAVDLAHAAPMQRSIQRLICDLEGVPDFPPAVIFHTALVVQSNGHRLEKRTQGATLADLPGMDFTATELCESFKKSFQAHDLTVISAALKQGTSAILGEPVAEIPLQKLLRKESNDHGGPA